MIVVVLGLSCRGLVCYDVIPLSLCKLGRACSSRLSIESTYPCRHMDFGKVYAC